MPEPALDPLVERDAELSALAAATHDAMRGEGRLVVVEGPAGIGKTRLLRSLRDAAGADGAARVLAAGGTELEEHRSRTQLADALQANERAASPGVTTA